LVALRECIEQQKETHGVQLRGLVEIGDSLNEIHHSSILPWAVETPLNLALRCQGIRKSFKMLIAAIIQLTPILTALPEPGTQFRQHPNPKRLVFALCSFKRSGGITEHE
jgi:hypothetical protein